jgi:hypothetical protein
MVRAAIQNDEIAQRKTLDDAAVIDVIARMVRQHHESISEFRKGNRPDLIEREEAELAVILPYMPPQLSETEVADLVRQVIGEVGATGPGDMGKVMGQVMPQVRGQADGSLVSRVVRELLVSDA